MSKRTRVTRKDVAERAGVSVAVVSYVVNNGPRPVAAKTQAKVKQAIEELGYYPNELARSLKRKESATIGLIVPSLVNPVYAEIAQSLEKECMAQGYLVMSVSTGRDPDKEVRLAKLLRAKQVDGVVVIPSVSPQAILKPLQQAGIPTVVLEHDLPGVACIGIDDFQGGKLVTGHLLSLGHRCIGMIKHKPTSALSHLRFVAYCETLAEAGVEFDPALVIESEIGQASGYASMQRLLALPRHPTALFAHNDLIAIGAIRAIQDAGLAVPDDISVVGYDDILNSSYMNPRLTTVTFSSVEMGRRAGQMIVKLAQKEKLFPLESVILSVELLVRASTAPLLNKGFNFNKIQEI